MLRIGVIGVLNITLVAEHCTGLDLRGGVLPGCSRKEGEKKLSTRVEMGKFSEQEFGSQPGSFVQEERQMQGCEAASVCSGVHTTPYGSSSNSPTVHTCGSDLLF